MLCFFNRTARWLGAWLRAPGPCPNDGRQGSLIFDPLVGVLFFYRSAPSALLLRFVVWFFNRRVVSWSSGSVFWSRLERRLG